MRRSTQMINEPSMHARERVNLHEKNVQDQGDAKLPIPLIAVMIQPLVSLSRAILREIGVSKSRECACCER